MSEHLMDLATDLAAIDGATVTLRHDCIGLTVTVVKGGKSIRYNGDDNGFGPFAYSRTENGVTRWGGCRVVRAEAVSQFTGTGE